MTKSITGHMIVRNEDQFVWYAISSVLPYVDRLIIFDTGSDDRTTEIIKSIKSPKIDFEEKNKVSPGQLTRLRQEQIDMTKTDWIWLVDGDEVYPEKTARKIIEITQRSDLIGIIVHRYDLLGDIYHYQDESIGSYNQFGKIGHFVLRLINKENISGFNVAGDYPNEYFADDSGQSIKNLRKEKFVFIEERIFHAMYLKRSSFGEGELNVLNRNKYKIELGHAVPIDEIPGVFYAEKPDLVPDVTEGRGLFYFFIALFLTPIKKIKRILLNK